VTEPRKCPRCEAATIIGTDYTGETIGGTGLAASRVTRDGGADVMICSRCGERESLYGRDPARQIPLSDWPVSIDRLVEEERHLITRARDSEFRVLPANELTANPEEDEDDDDGV
jgi:hypothetical protein